MVLVRFALYLLFTRRDDDSGIAGDLHNGHGVRLLIRSILRLLVPRCPRLLVLRFRHLLDSGRESLV